MPEQEPGIFDRKNVFLLLLQLEFFAIFRASLRIMVAIATNPHSPLYKRLLFLVSGLIAPAYEFKGSEFDRAVFRQYLDLCCAINQRVDT